MFFVKNTTYEHEDVTLTITDPATSWSFIQVMMSSNADIINKCGVRRSKMCRLIGMTESQVTFRCHCWLTHCGAVSVDFGRVIAGRSINLCHVNLNIAP